MEYLNERLLPGQIGHLLAVLSFVASLSAAFAYFMATQRRETAEFSGWRIIGRASFIAHGVSVLGVIAALFFILVNKYYEYNYAFSNVSDDLPFQYTFAAFWKDQQGSFLLWSFWHIVLSAFLLVRGGRWEAPALAVVSLAEAFIASMILGLYFGESHIGVSAFELSRDVWQIPIFGEADYLSRITGNGLNPLLQNYWMTIHPPTLFLGFASTIFPFAFAMAGLWTRSHKEWLQPALSWTLFSGAILGTGILMGAVWAYEALSFGGYWAWDPVENTSLVPWLTLVAGLHTNLIARATGYSIKATYFLYLITFILVLYSTYLTRSGILGDSSAHAFTEMGLGFQLVLFIGVFSLLALGLYQWVRRTIPRQQTEETIYSREFWMLIGSLVLLFSAILITGATSLPVWNKLVQLFSPDYVGAALKDPVAHHNRYQLWTAVFIGLLSGVGQFLRYGERNWAAWRQKTLVHLSIATAVALGLTLLNALWLKAFSWQHFVLLFAGMFTVAANADFLVSLLKGNFKLAASVFSHAGFGILILGVLGTGLNKTFLSSNPFAMEGLIEGADADLLGRNVLLMKQAPMPMRSGLEATYLSDTIVRQTRTFRVKFRQLDEQGRPTGETFVLEPNVMYDRQFSKVVASNPSTHHYWNRDIFTHVTSLPKAELDPEFARQQEDSTRYDRYEVMPGDTVFFKKHYAVVEGLTKKPDNPDYHARPGDLAFGLNLRVFALDDTVGKPAQPVMCYRPGEGGFALPAILGPEQMRIRLTEEALQKIFRLEDELRYEEFKVKEGESFGYKGYQIRFAGVGRQIDHPNYEAREGDLAVAAQLEIQAPAGAVAQAAPLYLIRDNQPFSLKDEVSPWGLHFQFTGIDPGKGVFTIAVAEASTEQRILPVDVAEDAPRSDYIVLEAILFPGINLVWVGSILMMFGLGFGFVRRFF